MEELAVPACPAILAILEELASRSLKETALVPILSDALDVVEANSDPLLARGGLLCSLVRRLLVDI